MALLNFSGLGKRARSATNQMMTPAARQVQEGLKLYQNQPKPQARANPYGQFKTPSYNDLSPDVAKQRAQDIYRPMYEQTRTQLGVDTQQQANLLRQRMNQVGQMGGGAEVQGNINLVSGLQNALANADTSYNTNVAQMQQDLIDRDREEKARQIQQALQVAQFNRGAMEADRAYDRGVLESDRGFKYQLDRDRMGDTRYADETAYNRTREGELFNQSELERQLKQRMALAEIYGVDPVTGKQTMQGQQLQSVIGKNNAQGQAALIRANKVGTTKRSSGSKSSSRSQSVGALKGTQSVVDDMQKQIGNGYLKEDLLDYFADRKDYWSKLGYDVNAIYAAIQKAPSRYLDASNDPRLVR